MNTIAVDPERAIGELDRNVFGGFIEHLGRAIYGGIYGPGSSLADESGIREDVLTALRRLRFPVIRYPGGNFASGYRWKGFTYTFEPHSVTALRLPISWPAIS